MTALCDAISTPFNSRKKPARIFMIYIENFPSRSRRLTDVIVIRLFAGRFWSLSSAVPNGGFPVEPSRSANLYVYT